METQPIFPILATKRLNLVEIGLSKGRMFERLETAGLQRKIGKNQVRAVRMMLSGRSDDHRHSCHRHADAFRKNKL